MKQKVITMICLKIILILQYLLIWQKKLFETKDKKKSNDFVISIKNRWSNLKDEIEKMSEDLKKLNSQIKY